MNFDDLSKAVGGDSDEMDKQLLGATIDAALDRTIKLIAIEEYCERKGDDKIARTFREAVEAVGDRVSEEIAKYQEKHGEI